MIVENDAKILVGTKKEVTKKLAKINRERNRVLAKIRESSKAK